ncbi:septum formation family protein [Cellulomonas triticagri]|uniref:Septum formation-related domain-containing protein n=1 Tax=Cellulomonas triticagri TaxID=2483352 RepID=A0A3M2JK15_9CELL|nr:septum formation family protein [Cellulomonas triticagri]RMI12481.1 hypothetical protein EBM89_08570 [Cellulomonas triticagri]
MSPKSLVPRWSAVASTVLAGTVLLALGACTSADASEGPAAGTATTVPARPYVPAIQAGDCLDMDGLLSAAADEETLRTVRCDEPHDGEVYAQTEVLGAEDRDDVAVHAQEFCADQFVDFVGRAYDGTDLEVTFLHPTEDTWDQGDRSVRCIVMTRGAEVDTTLAGSGR